MIKYLVTILLLTCSGCFDRTDERPLFENPILKTECLAGRDNYISDRVIKNEVTFNIESDSGIGEGSIELVEGNWPTKVTLNFYLKGLEGLNIAAENKTIELHDLEATRHETENSSYYEVTLPNDFLATTKSIKLQWIDFYR